jgi:hypothetical protein
MNEVRIVLKDDGDVDVTFPENKQIALLLVAKAVEAIANYGVGAGIVLPPANGIPKK